MRNKSFYIEAVKCQHCGRIHDKNDITFIRVEGNIYIGIEGGIVGNNIFEKDDGIEINSSIFCRSCFFDILEREL